MKSLHFYRYHIAIGAFFLILTGNSVSSGAIDTRRDVEEYNKTHSTISLHDLIRVIGKNASYTGKGITIKNSMGTTITYTTGVRSDKAKFIDLEDCSIEVTNNTGDALGVFLENMAGESFIKNSSIKVSAKNKRRNGFGISVVGSNAIVSGTDVSFVHHNDANYCAVNADNNSYVALKDNSSISIGNSTGSMGVLKSGNGSTINVSNSIITSSLGNNLINGTGKSGSHSFVNLAHVDLSNAKNQVIYGSDNASVLNVGISNTHFDGVVRKGSGIVNMDMNDGASWNLTEYSNMGGRLTLDGSSSIYYNSNVISGDFYNINAMSVMLAEGSILQLDWFFDSFEENQTIWLFTGIGSEEFWNNEGVSLVTIDGVYLEYTDHYNGSFTITGALPVIPEPTTTTLGLATVLSMMMRRRRYY